MLAGSVQHQYPSGVGELLQPLFIYFQALACFAPDGIKISLVAALFEYIDLLLELNCYYFNTNVALQGQVLICRPADSATGKRTKPFPTHQSVETLL